MSDTSSHRPDRTAVGSFVAGVLTANSLGHLATAVSGKQHLTPLAGRSSGPLVNLAWGAANLGAGLLLARQCTNDGARWDGHLVRYDAGAAMMAAWMFASEGIGRVNSRD